MTTDSSWVSIRGSEKKASDPPTIDENHIPSKCLSLTISADWGHFRRIDRTVTKQTYRVPPRTTIAGMLAAIVGVGRDGYYDVFREGNSAISIEIESPVRTHSLPSLGLGTHPGETFTSAGGTGNKTIQVQYPDSTANRQLHSYHYLVDPVYRINVAVEDPIFYGTLRDRLENGESYYTPSMGLSELLMNVTFHSEQKTVPINASTSVVDSVLPDAIEAIIPSPGQSYAVENVPGFMTTDETGRHTTGLIDYAFVEDSSRLEVSTNKVTPVNVGDRTVVFR